MNECKASKHYPNPQRVNGLKVDFITSKPCVKIGWQPIDPSTTNFNWTSYAIAYTLRQGDPANCRVIPQNETQYVIPVDKGWMYQNHISVEVVTHPFNVSSSFSLRPFIPKVQTQAFPYSSTMGGSTKITPAVVGGSIAGFLFVIIALVLAIKWQKNRSCSEITYALAPKVSRRKEHSNDIYYVCYYPESDEFRQQVASIVNYLRQSGYNVVMDVMVSEEISSQGPTRWAERQIRKARKVLVFLSPGLVNLAQDEMTDNVMTQEINRVWIELELLRDIYTRNRSASKMVCITLPNAPIKCLTLPLWASTKHKWPKDVKKIFKRLKDRAMILTV